MSSNPTKSIFGVTQDKLLGHIVSNSGISIDRKRVIAIQNIQSLLLKRRFNHSWVKSILLEDLFMILQEW
jgi:hypothetical protein